MVMMMMICHYGSDQARFHQLTVFSLIFLLRRSHFISHIFSTTTRRIMYAVCSYWAGGVFIGRNKQSQVHMSSSEFRKGAQTPFLNSGG